VPVRRTEGHAHAIRELADRQQSCESPSFAQVLLLPLVLANSSPETETETDPDA
jgi:hypothetical protein